MTTTSWMLVTIEQPHRPWIPNGDALIDHLKARNISRTEALDLRLVLLLRK